MVESSTGPIWRLVEDCANDLTTGGLTPFTRGDLIACVRRKNSRYGPDSINPIIQGLTANLRGGASGAVGKNILYSVGRGLFELSGKSSRSMTTSGTTSDRTPSPYDSTIQEVKDNKPDPQTASLDSTIQLCGYTFDHVVEIFPERSDDERVMEFHPQSRYSNDAGRLLNRYGDGPFCKFKIPTNMCASGVYAIKSDGYVRYIGECQTLSDRFNMGYGNMSPRNCFVGGQDTNCRINNLIFEQARLGATITLWFHATDDYKEIERELRHLLKPEWNLA